MGKAKKVIFFAILGFCVCIFILGSVLTSIQQEFSRPL